MSDSEPQGLQYGLPTYSLTPCTVCAECVNGLRCRRLSPSDFVEHGAREATRRIVVWPYDQAKETMPIKGLRIDDALTVRLRMLAAQTAGLAAAIKNGEHLA